MGASCRRVLALASVGMGLLVSLLCACRSSAPEAMGTREARVQDPASIPSPAPGEKLARQDMFERLVADIRTYHLFPDAWPEEHWAAGLPALEREVTGAVDRSALLVALS